MRSIYSTALARFDLSEAALAGKEPNSEKALLRGNLIWFMALDANHADLRDRLNKLGQAYLGYRGDGKLQDEVLDPSLIRAALIVAMQEEGAAFADMLISRLDQTKDTILRHNIISALGYQTDPEIVKRVWQLILSPETSKYDASRLLRKQGQKVANRDALYRWIASNYDEILERLPRAHRSWLPWRVSNFCDEMSRTRIEYFFTHLIRQQRGGPRILANVLERISLCTVFSKTQRQDAVKALAAGN